MLVGSAQWLGPHPNLVERLGSGWDFSVLFVLVLNQSIQCCPLLVIKVELLHHSNNRRSRHTMLSIPWPLARKDLGSWPSTRPAPCASLVPSSEHKTQPYVPSRATADPSLHAMNEDSSILR